jgi:hypothetical protein
VIANADAVFEMVIRADKAGNLTWLMAAADGTAILHEDVSVLLRKARTKLLETPDVRVLTMSEMVPPKPVLPEGWAEKMDGHDVTVTDGVQVCSRTYVHVDGQERVAPCGADGKPTRETVTVLGLETATP